MKSNVTPMPIPGTPEAMDTGTLKGFLQFLLQELKPKGKILTPWNIITGIIILGGIIIIGIRLVKGLGAVTNLSQAYPWGIWIGFDVVTGVAFAGGAYILTFAVHILKVKKYEPIVRATVLNGFLAYLSSTAAPSCSTWDAPGTSSTPSSGTRSGTGRCSSWSPGTSSCTPCACSSRSLPRSPSG